MEVLLDLLGGPNRVEAERVFERAFARGLFSEREVVSVLERRRSASLAAEAAAAQHTGGYQSPNTVCMLSVSSIGFWYPFVNVGFFVQRCIGIPNPNLKPNSNPSFSLSSRPWIHFWCRQ